MTSESNEQSTEESLPTMWHILQKMADEKNTDEDRGKYFAMLQEKQANWGESVKEMIRYALDNKDMEVFKYVVQFLENNVQGKYRCTPTRDYAMQEILDKGEGTIFVGTGSLGGRIHIYRDRIFMHPDRPEYDGDIRKRFQNLFGLTGDQLEAAL